MHDLNLIDKHAELLRHNFQIRITGAEPRPFIPLGLRRSRECAEDAFVNMHYMPNDGSSPEGPKVWVVAALTFASVTQVADVPVTAILQDMHSLTTRIVEALETAMKEADA